MTFFEAMSTTVTSIVDKLVYVIDKDNRSLSPGHNPYDDVPYFTGQPETSGSTPPPDSAQDADATPEQLNAVTVMLISFSIFGCLGNGLVLYVFSKKSDKVSSTIFILALAWTDLFVCLIFMPYTAIYLNLKSVVYFEVFCKSFNFINTSNVPLSAFLMVAIAVDRYFSICHPFLHFVTPKRAKVSILCLVLFAFSLGSITSCLYGIHSLEEKIQQLRTYGCVNRTTFYNGTEESGEDFKNITIASFDRSNSNYETCRQLLNYREGECIEKYQFFPLLFLEIYQKIYISFYIISLLSVFTLYFFIYQSVVKRRAWRRRQRPWSHSPMTMMTSAPAPDESARNAQPGYGAEGQTLELTPKSGSGEPKAANGEKTEEKEYVASDDNRLAKVTNCRPAADMMVVTRNDFSAADGVVETSALSAAEKRTIRERRDFNFLANIRTASMLFVVAVVFIFSFLPAWLMATKIIDYHVIVFYFHFFYNVVNPVIYAFMNQSFRKELKRVFQRDCRKLCCHNNRPSYDQSTTRAGTTVMSICESPDDNCNDSYRTRCNTE